jgi:sulfate adenylyltransferase subunit 1
LKKNEIAVCEIVLAENIVLEEFRKHKTLGELILIDRITNMTSACGVIRTVKESKDNVLSEVTGETRARQKGQQAVLVAVETMEQAKQLEKKLILNGNHTMVLGEESKAHLPFAAELLLEAGLIVIAEKTLLDTAAETERKKGRFVDLTEDKEHPYRKLLG